MKNLSLFEKGGALAQEQLFYLLYGYAMRICVRYTAIENDPEATLYKGVARFLKSGRRFKLSSLNKIKTELKFFLVDACIEKGQMESHLDESLQYDPSVAKDDSEGVPRLSGKQMIDALRIIPFLFRAAYNMSVIDGYNDHDISAKLQIPFEQVQPYISLCRYKLHSLLRASFEASTRQQEASQV